MALPSTSMRALIEPSELASYMRRPTLDNDAALIVACELASGMIRDTIAQEVTAHDDDTYQVVYPFGAAFGPWMLPELPVRDVSALTINGVVQVPEVDYVWDTAGLVVPVPFARRWLTDSPATIPGRVVITYDHGWLDVPEGIRSVALAAATRLYDNPSRDVNRAVGAHNESYTVDLTLNEQRVLARHMA